MKKILLATAVASTLFASQAFAQASNFTGFSGAINLNIATSNFEVSGSGTAAKIGDSSQNLGLQAAYGFAVGSNVVLNVGGTYGIGDMNLGKVASGTTSAELKGKDMYSIYLEPGYAVSNSTLVYGKLAYLSMKAEGSSAGSSSSQDFSGVGYGFGIRTLIDKNLFLQAEFTQSNYDEKTDSGVALKPSATTGTVGIGYKF